MTVILWKQKKKLVHQGYRFSKMIENFHKILLPLDKQRSSKHYTEN